MNVEPSVPLKVGVLFCADRIGVWQARLAEDLCAQQGLSVSVLNCRISHAPTDGPLRSSRSASRLRSAAMAIEKRLFARGVARGTAAKRTAGPRSLGELKTALHVDLLDCRLDREGELHFGPEALSSLEALSLDALICLEAVSGRMAEKFHIRFGAWALHCADGSPLGRDIPTGFWEVYHRSLRTAVTLERVTGAPSERWIIRRGWYPTEWVSWTVNHLSVMEHARFLVLDSLMILQRVGVLPKSSIADFDSGELPRYNHAARIHHYWIALLKLGWRKANLLLLNALTFDQWYVLFGRCGNSIDLQVRAMRALLPPGKSWWADPFIWKESGRTCIFLEEKTSIDEPATICVLESGAHGFERIGTALSPGYPVSYPFIFEFAGGLYMVPETICNRTVELWECTRFPLEWRRRRILLHDVQAADSTLLCHGGRWWMFSTFSRSEALPNYCLDLFIFHTDDPINGTWTAHPLNPVVTDCRRARMAGPFFRDEEHRHLYRVAQSNSRVYGESLTIMRVDHLSTTEYRESSVRIIAPTWKRGLAGAHHLSRADGIVVMDAKRRAVGWRR